MGFSRQEYWSGVPLPSPQSLAGFGKEEARTGTPLGTAAFAKWIEKQQSSGEKIIIMRYPDEHGEMRLAYCLEKDKQTMLNAGAEFVRDFN